MRIAGEWDSQPGPNALDMIPRGVPPMLMCITAARIGQEISKNLQLLMLVKIPQEDNRNATYN